MPGRPMMNRLEAEIERLGGDEVIFDRIAAGEKWATIAADYDVSRPMMYKWIRHGGPDREQAYEAAKKASADALVDEGGEILDTVQQGATPAEVSIAKERAHWRKWLAGVRNRDEYGERTQAAGQVINIGELHLSALRQFGTPQSTAAAVEGEDYEVLPSPTTQTVATPEDITKRAGNATEGTTAEAKDSDPATTEEAA